MATSVTRASLVRGAAAIAAAGALSVAATSKASADTSSRIAIIGSGYGGAVAAKRLTEKGYTVDMIEMGADWEKMAPQSNGAVFTKMTNANARSMWFLNRTDLPLSRLANLDLVNQNISRGAGVLGVEYFDQMKVYVGKGVGGGSLANGGMAVTPSKSFFQQVLPQLDVDEMFSTYFPKANAGLGVTPPPKDLIMSSPFYQFTRVGVKHARRAGFDYRLVPNVYDWDYMRRETYNLETRSATDGYVIFGNDHGKKSLPKTYLKEAFATGKVNLKTLTEVTSITQQADGTFELATKTIDFDGNVQATKTTIYDKVVLAAGSVGTSRLLMKAKNTGTLPSLPEATGKKWGTNGNIMLAQRISDRTGTRQSGIPSAGVTNWDDSENSVFAEVAPFPTGLEMRTNMYLAITNNPNLANYTWDVEKGDIGLNWTKEMNAPSVNAAKAFFDKVAAANSGTRYRNDLFQNGQQFVDYFTYHPLGGMILGEATDLNGEVRGVPGLFVMDGSLIPGKIGVNPFVTITAIAERNMDKLIASNRF